MTKYGQTFYVAEANERFPEGCQCPDDSGTCEWCQVYYGGPGDTVQLKLARLSACECGYGTLHDNIKLGTEYTAYPDTTKLLNYGCGGCGKTIRTMCIFVDRGGSTGFLPLTLFEG